MIHDPQVNEINFNLEMEAQGFSIDSNDKENIGITNN